MPFGPLGVVALYVWHMGRSFARWTTGFCLHGSDSWTVVIEGMAGDRFGGVPLCYCDELTLSSGGRRSVGWTVVRLLMALVWPFASGVAVDQLLVGGGSPPAGLTLPPPAKAPCPCRLVGNRIDNPDQPRIYTLRFYRYFTTTALLDSRATIVLLSSARSH